MVVTAVSSRLDGVEDHQEIDDCQGYDTYERKQD